MVARNVTRVLGIMVRSIFREFLVHFLHRRPISIYTFVILCNWLIDFGQALNPPAYVEFRKEAEMKNKLLENALIPELLKEPPKHAAEFTFPSGAKADFGNKIPPQQVSGAPRHVTFKCEPDELFAILLTDFDAPSRSDPHKREWVHWAVGNCEANEHVDGVQIIAPPMFPINPQRGTGFHRYVFYVYKQPNNTRIEFLEGFTNTTEFGRSNYDVKKFAKTYKLGDIYAINFFLSEWTP
ncbi:unnamed protein product [Bemisia tabaci]|uniref:Phosphatidylethanolamine-binding protein n=1 Tax=Bemisia tabaci TaxID=7038 RepID=A0A9P0AC76_BEMTA|nr:unnamed protein product [Bemisia tabaci]